MFRCLLAQGASETTVRQIPFLLEDIPTHATHLSFEGDIASIEERASLYILSLPWVFSRKTQDDSIAGTLRIAEGLGPKVVRVYAILPKGRPIQQGTFSTIAGIPPIYLWTPYSADLVQSKWVGRNIMATFGATTRLMGISGASYILQSPLVLGLSEEVWFDEDLVFDQAVDAIQLVSTNTAVLPIYQESHSDFSAFWDHIRDFWSTLDESDRLLIESNWRGVAQQWGQLLQRFHEIDASESLVDLLRYRRGHWARIDTRYNMYSSGDISSTREGFFEDKLNKPFLVPLEIGGEKGSVGQFITWSGRPYEITEVSLESLARIAFAPKGTFLQQTYAVGGQYVDDLSTDHRFWPWIYRSYTVFLDGEEWASFPTKECIHVLGGAEAQSSLRVRMDGGVYAALSVSTAAPNRLSSQHPVFSHALLGVHVRINGTRHRIAFVDPAGFWVDLFTSLPAGVDYRMECIELDHSVFFSGKLIAGSRLLEEMSGGDVFHVSDVGLSVTLRSGAQRGTYRIVRFIDASTVELDTTFGTSETGLEFVLPCDLLADRVGGRMRRMSSGRCENFSYANIIAVAYAPYRVYGDARLAKLPVLQEWTHDALSPQKDLVEGIASTSWYVGHTQLLSATLWNRSEEELIEGEDYVFSKEHGLFAFFSTHRIQLGQAFTAEVSFQPWVGQESIDFFVEKEWVYFRTIPQVVLWAPEVYFNHEDPYRLFGRMIDFYAENTEAYYYGLIALWSAYWIGPRRDRIAQAVHILLGLPFSEEIGEVLSVVSRFIGGTRQDVVLLSYDSGRTQEKWIPDGLRATVLTGQRVEAFHPLAGFHVSTGEGKLEKNTLRDTDGVLFSKEVVDGWVAIKSGTQQGVYRIRGWIQESLLRLDADFVIEEEVVYTVFTPAIRIFDQSNYSGFLQALIAKESLEKYMLPQATDANYQTAQKILESALFYLQIPFESFSSGAFQGMGSILSFLQNIKPSYTDFIFQLLFQEEDEILLLDDDAVGFSFEMDLTSSLRWEAATLPFTKDVPRVFLQGSAPEYIGAPMFGEAEVVTPNTLRDTTQSPFSLDMVGDTLWLGYGIRLLNNLGVAPSIHPQLVYSMIPAFSKEDVGSFLWLSTHQMWMRIHTWESPTRVYVDKRFDAPAILVRGWLGREPNAGLHTTITAYLSPSEVTILPNGTPSASIAYVWIPRERHLDSESILFSEDVDITLFDSTMAFLQKRTPWQGV